jgi:amino-acid N-acetyltransferase
MKGEGMSTQDVKDAVMDEFTYRFATDGDLAAVQSLLVLCHLPTDGIEVLVHNCLVAQTKSEIVGMVALEQRDRAALFRSLAVAPDYRGRGLGQSLSAKIVSYARLLGVEQLYLLTTDAEHYFTPLGFTRTTRDEAPAAIRETSQFQHVCPSSAVCMFRDIRSEPIHASTELLRLQPDVPGAQMWAVALRHTMLTYFEVKPHSRFDFHSHESEQITMVLSGELFFDLHGSVYCVRSGEVIGIPSCAPHAVWTQESPVKAIDAWSPVMKKYEPAKA